MSPAQLALRTLRTTHALFLVSIVLYALVGEGAMRHPANYRGGRTLLVAMAVVAVGTAGAASVLRGRIVAPAAAALHRDPRDAASLRRWQTGTLSALALTEVVALCGLALRGAGASLEQALPFYLAGMVLMMAWRPRLDLPPDSPGPGPA